MDISDVMYACVDAFIFQTEITYDILMCRLSPQIFSNFGWLAPFYRFRCERLW